MTSRKRRSTHDVPAHGQVWWLEDAGIGRRPVVILTRSSAIDILTRVVVAPITRTVRQIASEVFLHEDDGMPERCVVTMDSLRTVSKGLLTRRITTLSHGKLSQLCEAMKFALEC